MNSSVRRAMLTATALHVRIYRASRGRVGGSRKGMPILLLTVAGRKTGSPRTAPVGYLRDQGRWIVAGSAGGMRDEPQWFRNLRSADRAHIEIGGVTRDVTVTVTEGQQREVGWQQILVAYPFFAGYQNKAARQIPVAVLQATGEPVASLGDD